MIIDSFGRRFQNLRVSLTAACNYACTYCVPDGKKLQAQSAELDGDAMAQAVALLVDAAGISRLRITGGEPLISPKFDEFLRGVSSLGLTDVAVTTNGQFLARKINVMKESGLARINVSLDTLDSGKFRSIARSGDLETVLDGIDQACAAGMKVKINMVPMKTANVDQVVPLLGYCLERGIELRFIELMNMGHLKRNQMYEREFVGMNDLLGLIRNKYEVRSIDAPYDSTSLRFEIPDRGRFGIIANESEPFCRTCTRLRLSSNGFLYGCLSSSRNFSIRHLLDKPYYVAINELQEVLRNALASKQRLAFTGETTVMKFIGG